VLFLALLTACGATRPSQRAPELVAIDIFGTEQITIEQLHATHGKELRDLGEALMREDPGLQGDAILHELEKMGDFALIAPALVGYYEPAGMKYYLTVDFVDRVDAARRMPFAPKPTGTYPDPDGLLGDWKTYESKVLELTQSRRMSAFRVECPAFHCLGDHTNVAVKDLATKFVARVPARFEELCAILRDDHEYNHRAAAAYLLAYSKDGPALVKVMLSAFRDSNQLVRNNAMRVISDIAFYHPELVIPLDPVLEALDYPMTTDRNKAAAILDGLLMQPGAAEQRRSVAIRAGSTLLAMLRLRQPNNHNFAHRILKKISGQGFGDRDYASWEKWLRTIAR
jgi:hypothetical protein